MTQQLPAGLQDFRNFLFLVWKHLGLPEPTPSQYDIAHFLQHGPRRKVIEAFRGVGKSWITSAFVCWLLLCNPQRNILVVSATKQRSDEFTQFTLRLFREMPVLQHLTPRDDQRQSMVAFDVAGAPASHAPSVKAVGIFGQMAGSRANDIIADDVEVPGTSFTQTMRDKLAEAVKEFDAILKPGGTVTYLGTPQTEDSLYNLLPERGYTVRIWPARYPSLEKLPTYAERLAPKLRLLLEEDNDLAGKPTDPDRFNEVELQEREASYGRSGFALQYQLDTSLSDADRYPLKAADLVVMDTDAGAAPERVIWCSSPDKIIGDVNNPAFRGDHLHRPMALEGKWVPYDFSVMAVDPSGRGADECAWVVLGVLNGTIYLQDWGGYRDGYCDETLEGIAKTAKAYKVSKVVPEANFGDGMWLELLKPHLRRIYPSTVAEEVKVRGNKEQRIIDTLEPVMNQHRLVLNLNALRKEQRALSHLPPSEANSYSLLYQLTRITREKGALRHDDRADALSIGVMVCQAHMGLSQEEAFKDKQERAFDQELENFIASFQPKRPAKAGWLGSYQGLEL